MLHWPTSTPTPARHYLAFRRYILDENGNVVGEQSPAVRRAAAQIVVDLVNYRDPFTADRVRADLRPWGGASASAIAEMPSGRAGNKTAPVADEILQPMLAAALHLVQVLGLHAVHLNEQIREHDRLHTARRDDFRNRRQIGLPWATIEYKTSIGEFDMARYSYTCADHGLAEVTYPIGTAPQELDCPQCGQPARRVYSSPMLSAADQKRMNLIDSTHETADRPEVVTSIPRGGRINSRPTPVAPPDPRLQKLPRP